MEQLSLNASLSDTGLQDVEQVRMMLEGQSVIDWHRLAFRDREHVDEFLRLVGFEPTDPSDVMRMVFIHQQAVEYYTKNFSDRTLAEIVLQTDDVRDLLLLASREGDGQRDACVLLKVMHVIHHVAGRELLFRLPVPASELFHQVETMVYDAIDGMKARGVRVAEFSGSRKARASILTKLLARTDSLAAEVHDRIRFRVVTESLEDLLGALVFLSRKLLPFNYVVPGESRNDLIDLRQTLLAHDKLCSLANLLQNLNRGDRRQALNTFSASGFRMINFVVDIPVRIDKWVNKLDEYRAKDGRTVFVLVEFQLVDRATDELNGQGDNRHSLYKQRQRDRVLERLQRS